MGASLQGRRIALLEARRESELASLVRRHGGEPVCVPALREVPRPCGDEVALALDSLAKGDALVVLATGVGLDRFLSVSRELGRGDEAHDGLAAATVVCRGPKPVAVLKREGLVAHFRAAPPHTTAELLAVLATLPAQGRHAVSVHDGGGLRAAAESLGARGAHVVEVQPYAWALPEDLAPLRELVVTIGQGGVDAVAVTTQIQARHLFEVAAAQGLRDAMTEALRSRVLVAAVGPTSARTLDELGVPPHILPEQASMGALVLAMARRFDAEGPS